MVLQGTTVYATHDGTITEAGYDASFGNYSVYVQVTDQNNKLYSKNRSIRCFDRTNPTLNAAVSNGLPLSNLV